MSALLTLHPLTTMTSDEKTLAFLARRINALERKNSRLESEVSIMMENQEFFKPIIQKIFDGIAQNGDDHNKILKHLGIE